MYETKTTKEYKWFIQTPSEVIAQQEVRKPSFFLKLERYIERQDSGEYHFKWLGISMMTQCLIITPLVGLVIMQTGNYLFFWLFAVATMYAAFIPSLAGLSTKTIIKTFFTTVNLNLAIIISAILVHLL